jgi:hypothetical protein
VRSNGASGGSWFGEARRGEVRPAFAWIFGLALGLASIAVIVLHFVVDPRASTDELVKTALVTWVLSLGGLVAAWALHLRLGQRGLRLLDGVLWFCRGGRAAPQKVLDLNAPFGVTTLANRSRSRATLALTTEAGSFYVSGQFDDRSRTALRDTLVSAFTVASDERALEAAAPDGFPLELDGPTFGRFHAALQKLDARCTNRLFLSGHRGDTVIVDDRALFVGERTFDLDAALEWHGALFREQAFGTMSVFQLTFVRQGDHEVAFVSLMPALAAPSCPGDVLSTTEPELERAVLRDMGLLNVGVEDAPPAHLRVAIERVFMLPLRAALDGAPVASVLPAAGETRAAS